MAKDKDKDKDKDKIHTPHDVYFKAVMEIKTVAEDLFKAFLPPELIQEIDWQTFRIADPTRLGRKPTQLYTDVTYQATTKDKKATIFLHAEHLRTKEDMIARELEYNATLMLKHKKQGHEKLPIIINLCIYNGINKSYQHSSTMEPYFGRPDLAKKYMFKPSLLVNLTQYSAESLARLGASARLMLLFLKAAPNPHFLEWLKKHKLLLQDSSLSSYLLSSIGYALQVGEVKVEDILAIFKEIYPSQKGMIMTAAQQLRQEGRQEGLLETAKRMLQKGLGLDIIQEITGLSNIELQQLR